MNTQAKALAILTVLINNHSAVVEHGLNNVAIINRMNRLLTILREVCFNLAKMEEKTASAIMETADVLVSEAIASYLNDLKLVEEEQLDQEYLNSSDEESFDCNDDFVDTLVNRSVAEPVDPREYDCNDQDCDPLYHYKHKFLQEPLLRGNYE